METTASVQLPLILNVSQMEDLIVRVESKLNDMNFRPTLASWG